MQSLGLQYNDVLLYREAWWQYRICAQAENALIRKKYSDREANVYLELLRVIICNREKDILLKLVSESVSLNTSSKEGSHSKDACS